MTGKEKLQALAGVIAKAHEELIRGDIVEVSSGELERVGLPLHEQSVGLDVLANEYHCIEYTAERVFESEEDLSPYDLLDIAEISQLNGLSEEQTKQSFLEMMTYKIKVLDNFGKNFSSSKEDEPNKKSVHDSSAQIALNKTNRTVRLIYRGIPYSLHHFDRTNTINYVFIKNLLDRPGEALDRKELGIVKYRTRVKDLPKTIGFTGKLKQMFFDVDSQNQTLTLYSKKILTPEEEEIVSSLVNKNNEKN